MKRAVRLATLMWCWVGTTSVQANDHDVAEMLAKHEIEYLQRFYAVPRIKSARMSQKTSRPAGRFITGSLLRMS